ncbi:MAG: alpha/beta hydrolase [Pseudomonadales bacterium]|jgi:pimeloyl-ACP methyl ester carboxylesterase|nr:alpha/beta hydrolase [Pseudomonadales bacterium]
MTKKLFLPGAGGAATFWEPVASRLPETESNFLFSWPGLGDQPAVSHVNSVDDLVSLVETEIDNPVDLIAQSMGGVVAARIAIERPDSVRRLVLTATSAGLEMANLGATDWRNSYLQTFPHTARWITEKNATAPLPVEGIAAPTLLIWGDSDPISPVAVGEELLSRIPNARLEIIAGGDHDLAVQHPGPVSDLIHEHLS